VFPVVYCVLARTYRLGWLSAAALVVCTILVVGASFWYLKARALNGSRALHRRGTVRIYRASKNVLGAAALALMALCPVRAWG